MHNMEEKTIREKAREMKLASPHMAAVPEKTRNAALEAIANALMTNKAAIMEENAKDMKAAEEKGISAPVMKRLRFDDAKLADVLSGIKSLIGLPDPLNRQLLKRELDSDLLLVKESCPIGVIGVIFEARPDAMVQVSTLCVKSGNCVILKGGSEAKLTNRKLFGVIRDAAVSAGLPASAMMLAETHDDIDQLLGCNDSIDLLIPRGSNEFVQHIMNKAMPLHARPLLSLSSLESKILLYRLSETLSSQKLRREETCERKPSGYPFAFDPPPQRKNCKIILQSSILQF